MLQQAIHLLELSTVELRELLQKELAENPILEEAPAEDQSAAGAELDEMRWSGAPSADGAHDDDLPFDVAETLFGPSDECARVPPEMPDEPRFEPVVRTPTSLAEHLGEQLRLTTLAPAVRIAAEQIIGNVDDDGYLRMTVEDIAEQCAMPVDVVQTALQVVQRFDPPGVAARDLRECLLIQLRDSGPVADAVAIEIVQHHLADLEQARDSEIAQALSMDLRRVVEAVHRIAALEPKPGRSFALVETHYVVPDVLVTKVGDGYAVILNEDGLPRLRISSPYRSLSGQGYETQRYLEDRLRSAAWLIESVKRRQRTLHKVTRSIVHFQRDFLDKGHAHLRLLSLGEVADDLKLHEATVWRVTASKFVETPQGIFPLTFFFLRGPDPDDLPDEDGEEPPDPEGPAPKPPVATAAASGSGPAFEQIDARGHPYRGSTYRVVRISARRR